MAAVNFSTPTDREMDIRDLKQENDMNEHACMHSVNLARYRLS